MRRISSDRRDGWYEITPSDALSMLETETRNRPLAVKRAERIALAIKRGQWVANGESIVLDTNGNLADGQHRLRACVIADKPITTYVVHMAEQLRERWFDSIDQGNARTTADRFSLDGVPHAAVVAAVAKDVFLYDTGKNMLAGSGNLPRFGSTLGDLRPFYSKHKEEIDHCIQAVVPFRKDLRGWIPVSKLCSAYVLARRVNREKADEWARGVMTGENLPSNSPIMKLRKQLQADALVRGTKIYSSETLTALIIKSWTYYNHDIPVSSLKWARGSERPPRFDDTPMVKPSRQA